MYVSDDELECSRLPMGHMCQEIPGRPSFRGDRHLLLLITQLVDESLKTCVILLEGIQNSLLCWSFCGQTVYSSLCFLFVLYRLMLPPLLLYCEKAGNTR